MNAVRPSVSLSRSASRSVRRRVGAALAFAAALWLAACETGDPAAGAPPALPAGLAVLHSDYVSASLSLVTPAEGSLAAANVLHSGSRAPRLSTALSGDVVLPSTADPRGWVTLVDRYPNAVITSYDPVAGGVVGQVAVGGGFAANPQDVAFLPDGRAYVSRFERNPTPAAAADGGGDGRDLGDDLLVVDMAAGAPLGRIPLAPHVPPDVLARPTQVALAGGRVWVALAALAPDFSHGAAGVVVGVDPARDVVDRVVPVPQGANCADLAVTPDGAALWVVCSGVFQEGAAAQRARSGLARIDLGAQPPAVDRWLPAETLTEDGGASAPLAAEVVVDGRGRPWVIAMGDLEDGTTDRLLVVDPTAGAPRAADGAGVGGAARTIHDAGAAFVLGGLLADPTRGRVWVADARPEAPRVLAFPADERAAATAPAFALDTGPAVGLPPRSLGWFGLAPDGAGGGDGGGAGGGGADVVDGADGSGTAPAGRAPDRVVSVTYGAGAGFGQDRLPDVVLDRPGAGGGAAGGLAGATDVLSLGHGGAIVLAFDAVAVVDGEGPDLRVHENVIVAAGADPRDPYAEVAVVSVSADGQEWRTFPFDYAPAGAHVTERFVGFAGLSAAGDDFDLAAVGLAEARFVRIEDAGRAAADGAPDSRLRDADGEFLDDPGNACCAGTSEGFDLDRVTALRWR